MDLMRYAADLDGAVAAGRLPPVDKWNPAFCGEIDLVIRRDGVWVHEGTPIGRARLVRLLSTVIRKEEDGYYFVTPAEKLRFTVEDAPFIAVGMHEVPAAGAAPRLVFTTNVGDAVTAGPGHGLAMRQALTRGGSSSWQSAPYIHVRAGLDARLARPVFYELVARGQSRNVDGQDVFGVASGDAFFPLADAASLAEE